MNKEVGILSLSYGNYVSLDDYMKLQNNWNELKKSIENKIEELKNTIFETSLISEDIDLVLLRTRLNAYEDMLSKVQELEQGKDE